MAGSQEDYRGVILGTAVGDALGLPREGLGRRRAMRLFGGAPLKHRLIFGRGMVSDDTEHTCMVAEALLASNGDPAKFARSLAWRLRWWFLSLPAGVGMATAKACIKLWLGFPPSRSGVWSAGNGPAMRAAILGVFAADDLDLLRRLVDVSTRITHTDPAAEQGALAVALAGAYAVRQHRGGQPVEPAGLLDFVRPHLGGAEMMTLIDDVAADVQGGRTFEQYLEKRGLTRGVGGYINHTVPACLFCWLTWPADFRTAVEQVILAGGDADSTGAIAGALAGVSAGVDRIPPEWIAGIMDWPTSVGWMRELARRLAGPDKPSKRRRMRLADLATPVRNLLFLLIVLAHGVRRLLPPY